MQFAKELAAFYCFAVAQNARKCSAFALIECETTADIRERKHIFEGALIEIWCSGLKLSG